MEIAELLSTYFAAIDDKNLALDVVQRVFAPGGRMVRPDGSVFSGPEEILAEHTKSFARFRATHHMFTDHLVVQDGDTATFRANIQAMHLWLNGGGSAELENHFVAGGVIRGRAELTPDGWRLSELTMRPTWRTGSSARMLA